jgi:ppGpp synthetase/RelA/SpoT-type nucleotidyltranferase
MSEFLISSRAKTQDTLVEKLQRQPNLQLNAVQDIAGVRIDTDLLLGEQMAFAREIVDHFGEDVAEIHDLRDGAHAGYRGVHVWLRLPAGRVEIQIRTLLQSLWANLFERVADQYGRGIRYGEPIDSPPDADLDPTQIDEHVRLMQELSAKLATTEGEWQEASETEDIGMRQMMLGNIAMGKAMMLAAVLLTLKGEIDPSSWQNPEGG